MLKAFFGSSGFIEVVLGYLFLEVAYGLSKFLIADVLAQVSEG
jgi:hypothetical protein